MATLHFLGTGSVVSDPHRTTTMLALDNSHELVLIDCGGDAVQRMKAGGIDPLRLKHMIITHEHPDHCAGFPLLMEKLWVEGVRGEFHVHGIAEAIDQVRRVHESFNIADWPDFPEIIWHTVDSRPGSAVLHTDGWEVTAARCVHPVPCIGLRVTDRETGSVLYYSADTEPNADQTEAAAGANVIIHEATGSFAGHASATQAARLAAQVQTRQLVLVHVPPAGAARDADLAAAKELFENTAIAEEGARLSF